ncbi:protein ALP1-like [Ischnura elegans]|uniref:protein ALP1-like n=1 Tax=Ischnura elegans TaxID=197161 RepID=UPI001ED8A9E6|nr:protein ALP1-like [Ischnura elegans]
MVLCCEDVLLLALLIKKRRRRTRRFRKHPMLMSRRTKGIYYTLYDDLCASGSKFFNYFRMSKSSFDELLGCIKDDITVPDTLLNNSIPAEEKLALTLRYFASGTSMTDLHFQYRISQPMISVIIRQVCKAIWERVKQVCFPKMTERFWLDTAAEFYQKTNFPHCLGAVDVKHVRVVKPENSGSLYYNYKNYFSVLLLAICDASYKFIYIDVGAYGKSSDSTVFKDGVFFSKAK